MKNAAVIFKTYWLIPEHFMLPPHTKFIFENLEHSTYMYPLYFSRCTSCSLVTKIAYPVNYKYKTVTTYNGENWDQYTSLIQQQYEQTHIFTDTGILGQVIHSTSLNYGYLFINSLFASSKKHSFVKK
jgi:hypothetical protein